MTNIRQYSQSDAVGYVAARQKLEDMARSYSNRMSRREFLAAAGALALEACGGSPFRPTPNGNGGNTGRRVRLTGNFVNYETGVGYNGSTVQIGDATGRVVNGKYTLENVLAGTQTATFTGEEHLTRKVKILVPETDGIVATIDAPDKDFPLDFFNHVARNNSGIYPGEGLPNARRATWPDGTVRWQEKPTFYLDRESLYQAAFELGNRDERVAESVFRIMIAETRRWIEQWFPRLTKGLFNGATIIEVPRNSERNPNNYRLPDEGTNLTWIIKGGRLETEGRPAFAMYVMWINDRNYLTASVVTVASPLGLPQDMCQVLGILTDYPGYGEDSLFWDRHPFPTNTEDVSKINPFPKDVKMFDYLYNRLAGAKKPDDTSHLETITATASTTQSINSEAGNYGYVPGQGNVPQGTPPNSGINQPPQRDFGNAREPRIQRPPRERQ